MKENEKDPEMQTSLKKINLFNILYLCQHILINVCLSFSQKLCYTCIWGFNCQLSSFFGGLFGVTNGQLVLVDGSLFLECQSLPVWIPLSHIKVEKFWNTLSMWCTILRNIPLSALFFQLFENLCFVPLFKFLRDTKPKNRQFG